MRKISCACTAKSKRLTCSKTGRGFAGLTFVKNVSAEIHIMAKAAAFICQGLGPSHHQSKARRHQCSRTGRRDPLNVLGVQNRIYNGPFQDDVPQGLGTIRFTPPLNSIITFEGTWIKGVASTGHVAYEHGSYYDGSVNENFQRHGRGTLVLHTKVS